MAYNQMVFTCFDYLSVHCSRVLYFNYYSIHLMGCRFFLWELGLFLCMLSLLITIVEILMLMFTVHVYTIFIKEYFPHIELNTIDLR